MKRFIIKTLTTGLMMFIPVFFLIYSLAKALGFMKKIVAPLIDKLSIDRFAGVLLLDFAAVLILVISVFFLGLLAYLPSVSTRINGLDRILSERVPGYSMIKGIIHGRVQSDTSTNSLKSVLVKYQGTAQIGLEVERTQTGEVIVFLPNVPNPQTGSAAAFLAEDVQPIGMKPHEVIEALSHFGKGIGAEITTVRQRKNTPPNL